MKRVFLFTLILLGFLLSGCLSTKKDPGDYGLSTVTDARELQRLIEANNSSLFASKYRTEDLEMGNDSPSAEYSSNDYTKTNVQVEGVDEGDIIKTDGSRIYKINWNRLQVINLLGNGEMELLLNEELGSNLSEENYYSSTYYSELYVNEHYLIVIGQKYEYHYLHQENNKNDNRELLLPYFNYSIMSIVEIYDIESLEKVDNYQVSGYLLGSRLINNRLYLISNHYIYSYNDFDIRPWYQHNEEIDYFAYEDIKYLPDSIYQSFTIITNISLEENNIQVNNNVFLAANSWGQIYVSHTGIYFATNYYQRRFLGKYEQLGLLISYQFDESKGLVYYGGSGKFKGTVINQFAIDEYNGYIRVATTEGWGDAVKNRLYIFKRAFVNGAYVLETISLLDSGLGKPGERIQSVRFNKDLATIVTFLQTDPFYTIDLSDPYHPQITGELEIPGFSTYQHPWGDNLVIGIGFDAVDGVTTGLKLSLYDISDISNPVEVGTPLTFQNGSSNWTYSEATYNHKAVMIDKDRNCFGFSLFRYNWNQYYYMINDYLIFDVDETREQPIQIKHSLSHDTYQSSHAHLFENYYHNFQIKRAFRVDDYLYLISDEVISSHNLLGDLSPVDELIFQEYNNK